MGRNEHLSFDGSTYQLTAYKGPFTNIVAVNLKYTRGESGDFAFVQDKEAFVYWNVELKTWKYLGLSKSDIVNALTSDDVTKALSAKQGKELKELIDALNLLITNEVTARENAVTTLQSNITNEVTARQNADTTLGERIDNINSLNLWIPKDAQANKAAIVSAYPTPALNWAAMSLADGYIYVNDGLGALEANWVNSGQKQFPGDVLTKDYVLKTNENTNLFDFENLILGEYLDYNDGSIGAAQGWFRSGNIEIMPNEKMRKAFGQMAIYNVSGIFLIGYPASYEGSFITPENSSFAIISSVESNIQKTMLCYGNELPMTITGSARLQKSIMPEKIFYMQNIIIVGKLGGDFKTINEALLSIQDDWNNRFTIILLPGLYTESVNLCARYISIVGINKETCIIRTFTNDYYNPPIDMACNNNLFNLTIIADDDGVTTPPLGVGNMPAYGIHFDIASRYENDGIKVQGRATVQNCRIISKHQHAVALGLWTNQYLEFINCEMYSPSSPAFRAHNYMLSGATNQKLLLKDCQIWNDSNFSSCVLQDPNNAVGSMDNTDTTFTFIRNVFYSANAGISNALSRHDPLVAGAISGKIILGAGSFGNSISELNM